MTMKETETLVYTVGEVAKLIGISRPTAYQSINNGEIPSIRIGRRILVPKVMFRSLLEGNYVKKSPIKSDRYTLSITELNLPIRIIRSIERKGWFVIADLLTPDGVLAEQKLLRLRNFGRISLRIIRDALISHGMSELIPLSELSQPTPTKACICDICGIQLKQNTKGDHLITNHPEYAARIGTHFYQDAYSSKRLGRSVGNTVKVYICQTCGRECGSPGVLVRHYQAEHLKRVLQSPIPFPA